MMLVPPEAFRAAPNQSMMPMTWIVMDPSAMFLPAPQPGMCWSMAPPLPGPMPLLPPLPPYPTSLNSNATPYRQPLQFSQSVQKKPSRPLIIPEPAPGDDDGPRQLIVNYLSAQVDADDLRQLFAPYGDIELTRIMKDPVSGESRGYGFVYFKQHADAHAAIDATTGRVLLGKRVRVSYAIPQRIRTDSDSDHEGKPLH